MGIRADILWARKSGPPEPWAVWGHVPVTGAGHDVSGMWWQGAEEPSATLISAREQYVVHPHPAHGTHYLMGRSLESWPCIVPPAGIWSPQPGCASTTVSQTFPSSWFCLQTRAGEWKKGNIGVLKCHSTSLRSLLVTPWMLALVEGAWSRGGVHVHSVTAQGRYPAH